MFPHDIVVLGLSISVWNAAFLMGVVFGYAALRFAAACGGFCVSALAIRYLITVYLSALAAQLFANAFDANTSLLPPPGRSWASTYLNPLPGPKTLYGVIVLLPVSVGIAGFRSGVPLARLLDLWSAPLLVVLAAARLGCFLQGCCHGARSAWFGISFPPGSPVYFAQLRGGLVAEGAWTLPVVPTQLLEAGFLAVLAVWALRRNGGESIFVRTVAAYSVFRFGIEFVRADVERGIYGPLATSQWIALAVLAVVAVVAARDGFAAREAAANGGGAAREAAAGRHAARRTVVAAGTDEEVAMQVASSAAGDAQAGPRAT